ncbi:type IV toxin-antitoxin system AbiEi family antitoxin domain-containing protein [Burkholderia sp. JPY481]
MTIESRIIRSIRQRSVVILRSEVAHLGSAAQVSRVLSRRLSDGRLLRVSKGVYCNTCINNWTG